ncbi:MAG: formylglycine-generating enzyme family protein [Pseudomonadota bacterium]
MRKILCAVLAIFIFSACSSDPGQQDSGFVWPKDDAFKQDMPYNPFSDGSQKDGVPSFDIFVPNFDGGAPGNWIAISAGTFSMGSPESEPCRVFNEDRHEVTLTNDFEITAHEVTQHQFLAVMGFNPSQFKSCGNDCPVDNVNWYEAVMYCNALSALEGLAPCYICSGKGSNANCSIVEIYKKENIYNCPGYRLPTEAEWEYAYRAGTTKALYSGAISSCTTDQNADDIGWYKDNSENTTHMVAGKTPNAWDLYDMAGNVAEWCHDWSPLYLGSNPVTNPWGEPNANVKVYRGGSRNHDAGYLRAAFRGAAVPSVRQQGESGFRCARTK